jgi:esterase
MLHATVHGQGPALFVLHGLFGSADNWSSLGKRWSSQFEVHLIDLRNHGRSPHFPTHSYPEIAADVLDYMGHCKLNSAHVLGHSMGGKAAMTLACAAPNAVKSLLVADIGPWAYPIHHASILKAMQELNPSRFLQRKEAETAFAQSGLDSGTRLFLLKNLYWEGNTLAWRLNLNALAKHIEEVGKPLPKDALFNGPTLFVRGELSSYIPADAIDQIKTHFPSAHLQTLRAAGHWLHADQPEAFYHLALDFFIQTL